MPGLRLDKSSGKLKISEADIERTATEILQLDGWRSFKMEQNFSERKVKVTGERGMPDRLYIRYHYHQHFAVGAFAGAGVASEVLWIEWKSATGKVSEYQKAWHEAECRRGAVVLVAGVDFPASIEGFKGWYENSGLKRR